MRVYDKEQKLVKMVCNQCGKTVDVAGGLLKAEFVSVDKQWGYFSKKDLEIHSFDLCEVCYDKMRQGFKIPADIRPQTEALGRR